MLNEKIILEIAEQQLKALGGYQLLEDSQRPQKLPNVNYEEVLTGLTVEDNVGVYVQALRDKIAHETESRNIVPNTLFTCRKPVIAKVSGGRVLISLCIGFPLVVA